MARRKKKLAVDWVPDTCRHERTREVVQGFYRSWQCEDCGLTKCTKNESDLASVDAAALQCSMLPTSEQRHEFVVRHKKQFPDLEMKAKMAWNNRDIKLRKQLYRKSA